MVKHWTFIGQGKSHIRQQEGGGGVENVLLFIYAIVFIMIITKSIIRIIIRSGLHMIEGYVLLLIRTLKRYYTGIIFYILEILVYNV